MISSTLNRASKRKSAREAFTNESGAIDLGSIMVGIIVIGIIGGVIAATVFAVIPWSQDNAAKSSLDSVATAESAYAGFTSDNGSQYFGNLSDLNGVSTSHGVNKNLLPVNDKLNVAATGEGDAADYAGIVKSDTGKYFYITSGNTKALPGGTTLAGAKAAANTATGKTFTWTNTNGTSDTPGTGTNLVDNGAADAGSGSDNGSSAGSFQAGVGFQAADPDSTTAYNFHESSIDNGGYLLHLEGAYSETEDNSKPVYDAILPLVDPNAPTVGSGNDDVYPAGNQWSISSYSGTRNYFRPESVTLSDTSGKIVTYSTATATTLQLQNGNSYGFDSLLPSSVTAAQADSIQAAKNAGTLTVDLVIEGQVFHFIENNS